MVRGFLFGALVWVLALAAQAETGERVALVVGNSAYPKAPLSNPGKDARDMASLLRKAGFVVDQQLDTTQQQLSQAVARFGTTIKDPKVKFALFYYAGHGLQQDWRNYLVPVSADIRSAADVQDKTVDVSDLLAYMDQAKGRSFLVILDACRDDPFAGLYRPPAKGLSQFDAPVGSLLAFATAPGSVAQDGDGENGLYTSNLLREFAVRGARLEDAFKRVRLNVRLASRGLQVPWESTSLEDDVYLFPSDRAKLTDAEQDQQLEQEIRSWTRVRSSNDYRQLAEFIREYPSGSVSELAQFRLNRLLALAARQPSQDVQMAAAPSTQILRDTQIRPDPAVEQAARVEAQRLAAQEAEQARLQALAAEAAAREQAARAAAQQLAIQQAEAARLAAQAQAAQAQAQRLAAQEAEQTRLQALAAEAAAREQVARAAAQQRATEQAEAARAAEQQQAQARARAAEQEARRLAAARAEQEASRLAAARAAAQEAIRLAAARAEQEAALARAEAARVAADQELAAARAAATRLAQLAPPAAPAGAAVAVATAEPGVGVGAGAGATTFAATPFFKGYQEHQRSYQPGDQFNYRVIDIYTRLSRPLSMQVTAVDIDADRVEYNNGEYLSDTMGNTIANPRGGFSTPRQFYPAELFVGKKWRTMFKQSRPGGVTYTYQYDMKVVGRETIVVPAGTFDTFKIEARGFNMQLNARLERNIWVAPGVSGDIAHEIMVRLRNGVIEQNDRQELVSLRQAGRGGSATR